MTCAEEMCGGGVRMASHYDRVYCGKCHLTIPVSQLQGKVAGDAIGSANK